MVHLDADLAVTLPEDRPGTLAAALRCVGDAGINLDGHAEIGGVGAVAAPARSAGTRARRRGGGGPPRAPAGGGGGWWGGPPSRAPRPVSSSGSRRPTSTSST